MQEVTPCHSARAVWLLLLPCTPLDGDAVHLLTSLQGLHCDCAPPPPQNGPHCCEADSVEQTVLAVGSESAARLEKRPATQEAVELGEMDWVLTAA